MSVVSATVTVAGTMFAVPSNDVPPMVLAVSSAVAVDAFPVTSPVILPVTFPVTSPVISPTNAVEVIDVAPVTTPASTLIVPSNKIADPAAGSRLIAPPESNVMVVPTASKVPSAVSVMFAAAAAVSVVVMANVPLVPAVNTAVSSVEPVMVITFPSMATSSTVKEVAVVTAKPEVPATVNPDAPARIKSSADVSHNI